MTTSYWIGADFATFAIALLLTGIMIPQILHIAYKRKLFDQVDNRKIHDGAVPRLGGITFLPSIIFSTCLVLAIGINTGNIQPGSLFENYGQSVLYLMCAEMLLFLFGITDDLIGVRYKTKFIGQIICAILICASGAWIHDMGGLFGIHHLSTWIGWCVSGFLVVYLVNAINLIDGIDGLASGLSGIALIFYGILSAYSGQWLLSLIAWAQFGTLVPFFYYNVFGNPKKQKKIFMGDAGAQTVGIILSFIALNVTNISTDDISADYNRIILAFSPLIIPAFDVVRVYFHRVKNHRNPFLPDKCHIHHKLLALGLNQRNSLCIILLAAIVFILANVLLTPYIAVTWLFLGELAIWIIANMAITKAIRKREREQQKTLYI